MNQTQCQGQEVETLTSMKGIRLQPFVHQVRFPYLHGISVLSVTTQLDSVDNASESRA